MFEKIVETLRVSAFFIVAFLIWALWSIEPFLANRPTDFQAAGSIIVAWAIFFYGRDRLSRENAIHASNKKLFTAAHNFLNARLNLHQSISENTQNMNSLSYARLLRALGVQDTEMGNNDEAIEKLERSLNDTQKHLQLSENVRRAESDLQESLNFSINTEKVQGSWAKTVYTVELGFAVLGTLQWGYGDKWVAAIHHTFPELEPWWYSFV